MEIDEPIINKPDDLEPRLGDELEEFFIERTIDDPIVRKPRTTLGEEFKKGPMDPARPNCEVIIGSTIPNKLRGEVIDFLKHNSDIFAWSHKDMIGIDLMVACYRWNIDPRKKLVTQKHRKFGPKKYAALTKEVKKLI